MLCNVFRKGGGKMSEKTPRIWEVRGSGAQPGRSAVLSDPSEPGADIVVDSPAWFEWLEAPTTNQLLLSIVRSCQWIHHGVHDGTERAAEAWHELLVGVSAVSGACAESVPRTVGYDHRCSAQRDCHQLAPPSGAQTIDERARIWLGWQIIMLNFRLIVRVNELPGSRRSW